MSTFPVLRYTQSESFSLDSRRKFLGKVAGLASTSIAAVPQGALGANERVRVGLIGAGDRGTEIFRQAMSIPGVEVVAFADVHTRRLEAAKKVVPTAETYLDHRLPARRQINRRRSDRHSSAPALRAFRQFTRSRQARLSREDDG